MGESRFGPQTLVIAAPLLLTAVLWADPGKLSIYPEKATLFGEGSRQRVLVTWTNSEGISQDVTARACLEVSDARIARVQTDAISAVVPGTTRLNVFYAGVSAGIDIEVHPGGGGRELSFVKDIVPIFTKFG